MQAPPLPRNRIAIARVCNDVAVLANLDRSVLQDGKAVAVPHFAEEGRADEGFDFEVVVGRVVDDAAGEGFAGTGWWAVEEAAGAVGEPVDADGADGVVAGPAVEEVREGLAARHL